MDKHVNKVVLFLFFGILITIIPLAAQLTESAEPKPIKVGHLGDWTGPAGRTVGPLGDAFITYLQEYVNKEKGGIPYLDPKTKETKGKVKVEVLYADTRYELPLTKSAYREFLDKGAVVYHSTMSPALEGLKKDFKRDKVPCFASTGNDVALWPPEWIYGVRISFSEDLGFWADWILENWKENRPPRIALMYADTAFGRAVLWGGPDYAKSKKVEIVAEEPVPMMPVDMSGQLLRIKQANPDFIISNCLGSQHAVILKDMKRLGIKIPYGTLTNTDAVELVELAGEAAEGVYFLVGTYPTWDESRSQTKWINENYRKYFKGKSGYDLEKRPYPDMLWSSGWIVGIVVEEALRLALEKVAPADLTGETVREEGINRMKNFTANGYFPRGITYYPNVDHRGNPFSILHQIKDLKDVMVTDWRKAPAILPPWMQKK